MNSLNNSISAHINNNTKLILWSSDFHISPIYEIKSILNNYITEYINISTVIIDQSLSSQCYLTNTCAKYLKVLTQTNGINLNPCPNEIRNNFYQAYKNFNNDVTSDYFLYKTFIDQTDKFIDNQVDNKINYKIDSIVVSNMRIEVDGYFCLHATSMCELYMPFGKPLIVIASTRYEIGRYDEIHWKQWNNNLERIANNPYNTIAANNRYDLEYLKYFTSIKDVRYIPSLASYIPNNLTYYRPTKRQILLAPTRTINAYLCNQLYQVIYDHNLKQSSSESNRLVDLMMIRELYPERYEYSDLVNHPAIVLLPYQVSIMSFFEYYRMNIPMYIPSIDFLILLDVQYHILNERTWTSVFLSTRSKSSFINKHKNSSSTYNTDPNNELDFKSLVDWISLSDYYTYPYIQLFDSWDHLIDLIVSNQINSNSYRNISNNMSNYNKQLQELVKNEWIDILNKLIKAKDIRLTSGINAASINRRYNSNNINKYYEINQALKQFYDYELKDDCEGQIP